MRRGLLFIAALMALTACEPSGTKPKPKPSPTASALYPRPTCTGTLSDTHKRICGNKSLDWLDRVLQKQWGEARKGAGADKLKELDAAQAKFLAARDACKDDSCVAKVYKGYITTAAPAAKPKPKPKPKPTWHKPVPAAKKPPVRKPPAARPTPRPRWSDRPRGPSCASQIGQAAADRLTRQCDRVTRGGDWRCSPQRRCGALRRQIARGCNETYRKPGFCPHL